MEHVRKVTSLVHRYRCKEEKKIQRIANVIQQYTKYRTPLCKYKFLEADPQLEAGGMVGWERS